MASNELPEPLEGTVVCVDGTFHSPDEPHVLAYDRGLLYGDGVYDSLPVYDGKALLVDRHMDRLYRSLEAARIEPSVPKGTVRAWVLETLERSGVTHGGCRIIVTRGVGPQGMRNADSLGDPTVLVIPTPRDPEDLSYGRPTTERARVVSTRTVPADSVDPKLKGLNYLENVLAERELVGTDATAGIMLDHQGRVAEAFDSNVFVVDGEFVRTPSTAGVLAGVTRSIVLETVEQLGYEAIEGDVTPAELYAADDVFLSGSGVGVSHVVELDGRSLGSPGAVATEIGERFRSVATSREYVELDV